MSDAARRLGIAAFGLLGAFALAQGNARSAPATAVAAQQPLEILPSGHPVVQVALDDSAPKRFVIDTGASRTTIMPQLRATMPQLVAGRSAAPLIGVAGRTAAQTRTVERLHVAGRTLRTRELLLLQDGPTDRLGVDGILGADIISNYVVALDAPSRTWRMTEKVEPGMLDGLTTSVPFTLDRERAPRLAIRVDGVEVPAVLDTGARGTIINWAAARAIGLSPDGPGVIKAPDIVGATHDTVPSVAATLDEATIGEAVFTGPKVRVADLPVFHVLGFRLDQPAAILGIDMFAARRFVIDHPGLRLHISPPATLATPQS